MDKEIKKISIDSKKFKSGVGAILFILAIILYCLLIIIIFIKQMNKEIKKVLIDSAFLFTLVIITYFLLIVINV